MNTYHICKRPLEQDKHTVTGVTVQAVNAEAALTAYAEKDKDLLRPIKNIFKALSPLVDNKVVFGYYNSSDYVYAVQPRRELV